MEGIGPISMRDPSPVTFFSPTLSSPKKVIVNGQTKLQNQEPNTFISFFIDLPTNMQQSLFFIELYAYLTTLNILALRLFWYKQVEVYKFELPPASSVR